MVTSNGINRILVVDDDTYIRDLLEISLQMRSYEVVTAADGHEGEAVARQLLPDAIILDVMMPGIDGLSVLRNLRSDPATENIPVVLLTAKTADPDVWAGWESGASYYMAKPFDIDCLLRFLASLDDPQGAAFTPAT